MEGMAEADPLGNIRYISLADASVKSIGSFVIDPQILLPLELTADQGAWSAEQISWEAIVSAMLKLLAYNPTHEHAPYYRRFILAVKPAIEEEFTEAAILKARNSDFPIAIEIFKALEGLEPDRAETKLNLALVYEDCARFHTRRQESDLAEKFNELAFWAYKRALAADPLLPESHYNLAHFYLEKKNFEKAREHLDLFLSQAKDHKKIAEARAIIAEIDSWGKRERLFKEAFDFINLGREEEGIERIKLFLAANPKVWNAWFILGWGCRRLGKYSQGKEAFLEALKLNSVHVDTLNELAICFMELGEFEESYRRLSEALRLEPENAKIISNLGVLALKKGNKQEAASFFRSVLALDEKDPVALKYLSSILLEQKKN